MTRVIWVAAITLASGLVGCSSSSNNADCGSITRPNPYTTQAPLPTSCVDAGDDAGTCEPICHFACPPPTSSAYQAATCNVAANDAGTGEVVACAYAPYPIDPTPCD